MTEEKDGARPKHRLSLVWKLISLVSCLTFELLCYFWNNLKKVIIA